MESRKPREDWIPQPQWTKRAEADSCREIAEPAQSESSWGTLEISSLVDAVARVALLKLGFVEDSAAVERPVPVLFESFSGPTSVWKGTPGWLLVVQWTEGWLGGGHSRQVSGGDGGRQSNQHHHSNLQWAMAGGAVGAAGGWLVVSGWKGNRAPQPYPSVARLFFRPR